MLVIIVCTVFPNFLRYVLFPVPGGFRLHCRLDSDRIAVATGV
jgi:hypothetical protein